MEAACDVLRRGLAKVRLGDYGDAKADLRKANELDPKSKEVRAAKLLTYT